MDIERVRLLKDFLIISGIEEEEYADNNCFYCEVNDGDKEPCRFKDICGIDKNVLKKELFLAVDELLR